MNFRFEWDEVKAKNNINKHKISFDEAITVFDDIFAKVLDDDLHSNQEFRYYIIGYSKLNNLLTVSFSERIENIRIISARLSTKIERKNYEKGNKNNK